MVAFLFFAFPIVYNSVVLLVYLSNDMNNRRQAEFNPKYPTHPLFLGG